MDITTIQLGVMILFFVFVFSFSRLDYREEHRKECKRIEDEYKDELRRLKNTISEMQKETRDGNREFHGRICTLEEKNRGK